MVPVGLLRRNCFGGIWGEGKWIEVGRRKEKEDAEIYVPEEEEEEDEEEEGKGVPIPEVKRGGKDEEDEEGRYSSRFSYPSSL